MMDTRVLAKAIRTHALNMVYRAKASHIGSALSIADIVAVLYGKILRLDPKVPKLDIRDRFILSKGHACVSIYAALAELNFFSLSELDNYAKDFSNMMTHISHKVPGVEFSTGSLGHGLPFGVGKALVGKRFKKNWRIFVLLSDGELGEGSNWEALMFAAHHKLDNLVIIIDYNKLQSLDTVEKTLRLEPLAQKLHAFGCHVNEVDGHNHADLINLFSALPFNKDKPSCIIAHTTKGKGVSFMENSVEWHYRSPTAEQLEKALKEVSDA